MKLNNIFIRPLTKLGKADSNRDKIGYSAEEFLEFYKNALEDYIIKKNKEGIFLVKGHLEILSDYIKNNEEVKQIFKKWVS